MVEAPEEPGARAAPEPWPLPHLPVRGDRGGALAELECLLVRAMIGGAGLLPLALQSALTGALARLAAVLDRRHSDEARRFLEQAFGADLAPERREELVRAAWRQLFASALEGARFDRRILRSGDLVEHFDLSEQGELPRVVAAGRGALVATCHLGAWEAMAALMPRLGLRPFYAVAKPPRNRPLSEVLQRVREARGYRVIPRHGALQHVRKVVAAGGYVALLVDQRARGRAVLAPFFGRLAHCERSFAVLARRLHVPLVVGAGIKLAEPDRYALRIPRVFWPEELAALDPAGILGAINAEFERMILAQPDQYLWLHDRYRKAPPAVLPAPRGEPLQG